MDKITVVHHCNQLGLGGTEKDMQIVCKYLNKDIFDVHVLAPKHPVPPHRIWQDRFKKILGSKKSAARLRQNELAFARVPEFEGIVGKDRVHFYSLPGLGSALKKIFPHVLHVHHAGASEPPLNRPRAVSGIPVWITTNVFGLEDATPQGKKINRILFVSNWLKSNAPWAQNDPRGGVLYCPIEKPKSDGHLRAELGIGPEIFVIGRIGRNADDIHDPISLKAYKETENENTLFLAVSPPPKMIKEAKFLGLRNFRCLPPTVDDEFLSRFYNTIDVLAHARADGETFGCVIAEAMIHGKPVVSHKSPIRNAQAEVLDASSGFVVDQSDWRAYAQVLKQLRDNRDLRMKMGQSARNRALENFEAEKITRKLEGIYFEELRKKGIQTPA